MKKQFDIKYRPQIESGEYKVETRDGRPVRIICWDRAPKEGDSLDLTLCVLIPRDKGEAVYYYNHSGKNRLDCERDNLFIITPEPELTEFEKVVRDALEYDPDLPTEEEIVTDVKEYASELLALAREQLIKDGYVIEKKAFHDAVENISDKHRAAMSVEYAFHGKVENGKRYAIMNWDAFQKVAQRFIDIGKTEALKDLPRWKKWGNGACGNGKGFPLAIVHRYDDYQIVDALGIQGEKYIMLSDLEKLPGFKED